MRCAVTVPCVTCRRHEGRADAFSVVNQELRRRRVVDDADARTAADARPQQPCDFAPGGVAGVQHASDAVRGFASKGRTSIGIAIEGGAPVEQLVHVARSLVHEDVNRGWYTESVTGSHRVARMQLR